MGHPSWRSRGELYLEAEDGLLPENGGLWHLQGGPTPRVERVAGGRGDGLKVSERGLSALYAGFHGVYGLARAGLVEGSASALRAADALFPQQHVFLPDWF